MWVMFIGNSGNCVQSVLVWVMFIGNSGNCVQSVWVWVMFIGNSGNCVQSVCGCGSCLLVTVVTVCRVCVGVGHVYW